ncbi:glycerol-3-phosphate 1-O-acyltransferase PlsY [uncultured Sphaerochaeta sp.]|uniref:glycerol-3-phosphate 1-O-acyltransferase PlsY n=1 Tax=uncultured Sphaerochaeta sp. TaxID=886478 RepID=UPI002A0A7F11|nr:glycerol-3-phosphate 1-O-acyltransferase PlsY [uncultured Sphaerochaeta sp.]
MISNLLVTTVLCLFGYVLGGIPTAYLFAKRKHIDLRERGSGNLGATNTSRTLGFRYGVMVGALDLFKGVIPSLLAVQFFTLTTIPLLCIGMATILGHIYTPFLSTHRGGKGVATGAGVIAVLFPFAIVAGLVVFFSVALVSRYISIASITTYGALIPYYLLFSSIKGQQVEYSRLAFLGILALLILFTHRTNIQRLILHMEPKFSVFADKEHS